MSKLMLIDATHPEETRVAVVSNGQIEDFDFEARDKRQLRGNIYLAKVTRVEPSLQAAFVEYGGNRHGFLAFSEIHPDYYQIPKEDRDALMAEAADEARSAGGGDDEDDGEEDDEGEAEEVIRRNAAHFQRKYKIQEVIRRRQVILVQVVKEERGNKGAALTTYLSLAGRYCVLMPNTARGGGISRKITNAADRRRLKKITSEFEVPRGAGLIVRTAGAKRTKLEIRRDFEYLTRLWEQIVTRTMESIAPALIHEEGHLVLRAVRDLYDKDVEQIIVEGEEAFTEARNFVRMLMPSHARKVTLHAETPPLFVTTGVEDQLESIFSPVVQLPSGGYIVINQTEALVAIDVNSGKATRERNVETTALKTNLEAATEACRQMRLRDLAGLVVIDFIDMEETKNNRAVEKRMKDSLKIDRARVQTGRISQFGLFEISRQRRRAGVLELSSEVCDHCAGTGRVRAIGSAALQLLRTIEARAADDRVDTINVQAPPEVALYILNEKRPSIAAIEATCHVTVRIEANSGHKPGEYLIEASADGEPVPYKPIKPVDYAKLHPVPPPAPGEEEEETDEELDELEASEDEDVEDEADDVTSDDEDNDEDASRADADEDDGDDRHRREDGRKRRGRRGGRRRRGGREEVASEETPQTDVPSPESASEDARSGGRGRRRRGGRDRDGGRTRIPDIAADGGERLDAIASAPFLIAAPIDEASEEEATASAADQTVSAAAETPPLPPIAPEAPPPPVTSEAEKTPVETALEHEIASSDLQPDAEPIAPPAAPTVSLEVENAGTGDAATEETERADAGETARERSHPLHGVVIEPEPKTPRKTGWWSRRRSG
ncbi:MAG: ribonuclease E/G [Alphaproteobacteria bacterium]|nr:ribonuclease E/G [Alphaproteobacteria bacterium]